MAVIAWALIGALPGEAQITPGSITEEIPSRYDEGLRHAIYVPSNYTADRAHPLVLVMDARGAALVPLTRMVEAAERLGYVVISSYDTSSDDSIEPTARAVEAMIDDAQRLFNVDARRLYFVGFSGTARAAWVWASSLQAAAASVRSRAARTSPRISSRSRAPSSLTIRSRSARSAGSRSTATISG